MDNKPFYGSLIFTINYNIQQLSALDGDTVNVNLQDQRVTYSFKGNVCTLISNGQTIFWKQIGKPGFEREITFKSDYYSVGNLNKLTKRRLAEFVLCELMVDA